VVADAVLFPNIYIKQNSCSTIKKTSSIIQMPSYGAQSTPHLN